MIRLLCLSTLVVFAALIAWSHPAPTPPSAISLDVSVSKDQAQGFGGLRVKCSLDSGLAHMPIVVALAVMGSGLSENPDTFDELAVVDTWSTKPRLAQGLDKENVVVKGRNGQKPGEFPYLIMSWHGQNSDYTNFQCVAHGIDSKGKLTSLSSDVKRKPNSVRCSHSKDSVYCELQKMSSKLEAIANTNEKLSVQVKALNAKYGLLKAIADTGEKLSVQMKGLDAKYGLLEAIADTGEKLSVHVKGLDAKYGLLEAIANAGQKLSVHVKGLDAKYGLLEAIVNAGQKLFVEVEGLDAKYGLLSEGFKELKGKSDSLRDQLSVKNRLAAINRDKFYVSRTHNNRVYLVRKAVESFNLARANRLCGESGGYLVEFDDTEELKLVLGIVSKVGGTDSFFTGGNDVDWEGHFVYYNSKKPVPNLRWRRGQPDNGRGSEDCMQIKVSWGALNDDQCYERGKYVCEVPLRDL